MGGHKPCTEWQWHASREGRRRRDRADEERGEQTERRRRDGGVWSRIVGRRRNLGDSRRRKPRRRRSHGGSSRLKREKTCRSRPHSGKNVAIPEIENPISKEKLTRSQKRGKKKAYYREDEHENTTKKNSRKLILSVAGQFWQSQRDDPTL
ncbi:hypothetical protein NDU88_007448 [Pleurodeles waltl]|uniref:Uncharacterized protein n=1 Tax=Pleurodeles waltl TaxID=8319 RepID=A0AAV7NTB2_PLEWA|nr:hypothetical protein NDU88_007448 [Pleurodeles waltl]